MKRNTAVDTIKVIMACMVVLIHTKPFVDQVPFLGDIIQYSLPRLAVPFFLLAAGYYYSKGFDRLTWKTRLFNYLRRMVILYTFWSIIYGGFLASDVMKGLYEGSNIFRIVLLNYFIRGLFYHLWYFPAVIFSVIVLNFVKVLKLERLLHIGCVILLGLGILYDSYNLVFGRIPGSLWYQQYEYADLLYSVFFRALPIVGIGDWMLRRKDRIISMLWEKKLAYLVTVLYFLELIYVFAYHPGGGKIVLVFTVPMIILIFTYALLNPEHRLLSVKMNSRRISSYIYLMHPALMRLITAICDQLGITINNLVWTVLTFVLLVLFYQLVRMMPNKVRRYLF